MRELALLIAMLTNMLTVAAGGIALSQVGGRGWLMVGMGFGCTMFLYHKAMFPPKKEE